MKDKEGVSKYMKISISSLLYHYVAVLSLVGGRRTTTTRRGFRLKIYALILKIYTFRFKIYIV